MQISQTMDELTLVQRAQTNAQAFGTLYDRYVQRVYRYCYYRTSSTPDAEDITAQIFLAALEALPRYRQDAHFAAWLFSIARRKVADFHRRNSGPRTTQSLEEGMLSPLHADLSADLAVDVETSQRRERLVKQIQSLAEEEQELIHLRYVAELSFAEMAKTLQRNEDAVKKSLYRLLARLKQELEADHG